MTDKEKRTRLYYGKNILPLKDKPNFQEIVETELGKPPYENLEPTELPFGSNKRKRHNFVVSNHNREKHPFPNYYNFGKRIEYLDQQGREYVLAHKDSKIVQRLVDRGEKLDTDYDIPPRYEKSHHNRLVFYIKVPISTRNKIQMPLSSIGGERVTMYHIKTQVKCVGTIEACFTTPKGKTGYVILRDFITLGEEQDSSEYREIISRKYQKSPL